MDSIISYIAESVFCGALFYILFVLLVSGKSSYNFQRGYLLISSFCTLVFPVLSIPVNPAYNFSITLPEITIVSKGMVAGQADKIAETGTSPLIEVVYFSLLSLFMLFFTVQLLRILYMYFRGEKSRRGGIIIVSSNRINSPFSFFNIVFLRDEDDKVESECVITHEKAHVKRGHSFDIILISIINIIQWFNPFIYFIKKSLVSVHEYQADKDVIMSGYTIKYYQNLMLYTQFGASPLVANSLNNSLTIKRLKKMENLNEKRNRTIMFVSVILMTSALFFVVSCKTNSGKSEVSSADTLKNSAINAGAPAEVAVKAEPETKPAVMPAEPVKHAPPPPPAPKAKAKTLEAVPFTVVEVKPVFMGGDENTFTRWVSERLVYPNESKEKGIQGRIILQFIVTEKGDVTNVKVVRGVDKTLDMEAARVVSSSPKWSPGKQKGENVAVRYTFPVIFKLK